MFLSRARVCATRLRAAVTTAKSFRTDDFGLDWPATFGLLGPSHTFAFRQYRSMDIYVRRWAPC